MSDYVGRCIALQSVPFFASGEQCYNARTCHFSIDTGCVELLLRDGRVISIDCTGVEDALDVTMAQRAELEYLIYNDPLGYADLILNGDPKEYLKNVAGSHGLEDWKNIICSLRQTVDMKNCMS